jgi:hypothetical protein
MIKRIVALTVAIALPAAATAQTLRDVKVEPAEIRPGESVMITVNFDAEGTINCGLRLHFGEGAAVDYKINQQRDLSLAVPRAYAKPGEYRIMAEPKTVGLLLKCNGKNQVASLKVSSGATAAPKAAAAGAARCPEGWSLDRKSARRKDGSFTCHAAPGTKVSAKLSCPGDLTYFENTRKGVIGCRP